MKITASVALLIYTTSLIGAYVWKTFYDTAPFVVFVSAISPVFTAYIAKRLLGRKFNAKKD